MLNLSKITSENVIEAIEIFKNSKDSFPMAKNTFLIHKCSLYPAKHIRWLTYKVALGYEIDRQDFSGGIETVKFFNKLGFAVLYKRKIYEPEKYYNIGGIEASMNRTEQKNALELLLQDYGKIQVEKRFDWMRTPDLLNLPEEYKEIVKVLENYRGFKLKYKPGFMLPCDYVIEERKLIIEYDEYQHFSEPRKLTLEVYPKNLTYYFPKQKWKQISENFKAKDNNPKDRDEKRAFYDTVRDIEAAKHGYKLVRILHGEIDWTKPDAKKCLDFIINTFPYN